jgi:hypothetical protein
MTRDEILQTLASGNKIVIDAPLDIATAAPDAYAGKLLLWLFENAPENTTWRDAHDILDAAKWWLTLLESTRKENDYGNRDRQRV